MSEETMTLTQEEAEFIRHRRSLLAAFKVFCDSPMPQDDYQAEADARMARRWEERLRNVGVIV